MIAVYGPEKEKNEFKAILGSNITDNPNAAEWVIIPKCGINIQKRFRRELIEEKKVSQEKILVVSKKVLEEELAELGSCEVFAEHCRTHIPYINSLDCEVTYHCNLNCKGCSHFSSLSEKKFADLDTFKSDIKQLRRYVDHIGKICLLGGEPLMNPDLWKFVEATREVFPTDYIAVITNGIRLGLIDEQLADTMRRTNANFEITVYPPIKDYIPKATELLDKMGVRYSLFWDATRFWGQLNIKGDSDPDKAECACFYSECHMIEAGHIAKCILINKGEVFRKHYNLPEKFPDCRFDLFAEDVNSQKLYSYLMNKSPMCRFCGKWNWFEWERGSDNPPMEDWFCCEKY